MDFDSAKATELAGYTADDAAQEAFRHIARLEARHIPTTIVSEGQLARDCLVGLMGARLADRLISQLYAAGFAITPIPVDRDKRET